MKKVKCEACRKVFEARNGNARACPECRGKGWRAMSRKERAAKMGLPFYLKPDKVDNR